MLIHAPCLPSTATSILSFTIFSFYSRFVPLCFFFFFFQAEDGIRDLYVTGVQTCALPISADRMARAQVLANESGAVLVPPYDHPVIISGQGTVGLEIADQLPDVKTVLVPEIGRASCRERV